MGCYQIFLLQLAENVAVDNIIQYLCKESSLCVCKLESAVSTEQLLLFVTLFLQTAEQYFLSEASLNRCITLNIKDTATAIQIILFYGSAMIVHSVCGGPPSNHTPAPQTNFCVVCWCFVKRIRNKEQIKATPTLHKPQGPLRAV